MSVVPDLADDADENNVLTALLLIPKNVDI